MDPEEFRRRARKALEPQQGSGVSPLHTKGEEVPRDYERQLVWAFIRGAVCMFALMAILSGIASWLGHYEVCANSILAPVISFIIGPIVVGIVNAAREKHERE